MSDATSTPEPPRDATERSPLLRANGARYATRARLFAILGALGLVVCHVNPGVPYDARVGAAEMMLGGVIVFVGAYGSDRSRLGVGLAIGAMTAALYVAIHRALGIAVALPECAGSVGFGTTAYCAYRAWTVRGAARDRELDVVWASLVLPLMLPASVALAYETAWLCPTTWDARAFGIDTALPFNAFQVGRFLASSSVLQFFARQIYGLIFLFVPLLYGLQVRRRVAAPTDVLLLVTALCVFGPVAYFVVPVSGPHIAFSADFPAVMPSLARIPWTDAAVPPEPRNCIPSFHTIWALLLVWNARPFHWLVRAACAFVLVFTVLATLGFGYHYVLDLVAAVPFAAAAQSAFTHVAPEHVSLRRRAVGGSAFAATLAILSPRLVPRSWVDVPGLLTVLSLAVVVVGLFAERRVAAVATPPDADASEEGPRAEPSFGDGWWAALVGFVAASMAFTVLDYFATAFSSAAVVDDAIVASALSGLLGLGVATRGGRAGSGVLLLAGAGLALAYLLPSSPELYARLAAGADHPSTREALAAAGVAASVAAPLGVATGAALGLVGGSPQGLVRFAAAGGAVGLFASAYVVLPELGTTGSLVASTLVALVAGLVALLAGVARRSRERGAKDEPSPLGEVARPASPPWLATPLALAVAAAVISFAQVIVTHLLALLVGGSSAGSALAWAPLLAGVATGAYAASHLRGHARTTLVPRAVLAALLAVWILALPSLVARVGPYFQALAPYEMQRLLTDRELARVFVWTGLLAPFPALAVWILALAAPSRMTQSARRPYATTALVLGGLGGFALARVLLPVVGTVWLSGGLLSRAGGDAFSSRPERPVTAMVQRSEHFVDIEIRRTPSGRELQSLVSDGRVVGDEGASSADQVALALAAARHAVPGSRVLRIGYDTGAVPGALASSFGADRVDVVEPDADLLALARGLDPLRRGADAVGDVRVDSPRAFLLRSDRRWGLVSLVATSPARAGARVFSEDFYASIRAHLAPNGVVDQGLVWTELRPGELTTILATLRATFPEVHLYRRGDHASAVACMSPCPVGASPEDDRRPVTYLLDPRAVDRWLAASATLPSTDDDRRIEHVVHGEAVDPATFPSTLAASLEPYRAEPSHE